MVAGFNIQPQSSILPARFTRSGSTGRCEVSARIFINWFRILCRSRFPPDKTSGSMCGALPRGTILFQNSSQNAGNGEKLNSHATLATDQTLTGVSGSAQTIGFWPTAIIGRTTVKPVLVIGDSLQRGIGDTNDGSSAVGLVPRALASTLPYISLGSSGDSIAVFLQSYAKRIQMSQYIRNIVAAHGTNDIRNGRTTAQIKTDLISYWRLLKSASPDGTRVFQCTLTHSTLSTDSWATPENQTASPISPLPATERGN